VKFIHPAAVLLCVLPWILPLVIPDWGRLVVAQSPPAASPASVLAPGAELVLVVDGCQFTEGPACDQQGNVFFTDQPNDRIVRIGIDGSVADFMKPAGRSNGMFFAPDGKLIACADGNTEMWEIDIASAKHRILFGQFENRRFNGPNDVWVHPSGKLYFTDPFYKRPWWQHADQPQPGRAVYSADRDGSHVRMVDDRFKTPNGIVGDAGRGLLFVADIGDSKTYVYRITPEGDLVDRQLFCEAGSDGMTIDRDGNLYLTGKLGVTVYDRSGKKSEVIAVPRGWTANVCFGGKDKSSLFMTAGDAVFKIETTTQGF